MGKRRTTRSSLSAKRSSLNEPAFPPALATPPIAETAAAAASPDAGGEDAIRSQAGRVDRILTGPVPPGAAMIMLGLAVGWQCAAFQSILASVIGPDPETTAMVVVIALLAAAVGPWLPGRVILEIAQAIQRKNRASTGPDAETSGSFWILRAVHERDDSLVWLSVSVLACAAGVLSLMTLLLAGPFAHAYHYLLKHFFWSHLTLSAMEWLAAAMLIGPSWIIHGLLAATLATVAGPDEPAQQPSRVVAGALLGLGLALIIHDKWAAGVLSAGQEFMAGLLPVFLVAAFAAKMSQWADRLPRSLTTDKAAPELPGGAEGLIWVSLVVWGISAALTGSGWVLCQQSAVSRTGLISAAWGSYTVAVGAGAAAAWWHTRRRARSASGCGMAAWTAGLCAGAAATIAAFHPDSRWSSLVELALLGLSFGYALHYAELAWLARAGCGAQGFAQLAGAILAGLAAGFIATPWWAINALGPVGLITAGSLLMMSLGGIVQIYEADRPSRTRHQRLAVVFASLAGAILLFPTATRRWDHWQATAGPPASPADLTWLASSELPPSRHVCLIGVDVPSTLAWPGLGSARVDILPFQSSDHRAGRVPRPPGRTRVLKTSPFRALRIEHHLYDLVYLQGRRAGLDNRFPEYTVEWLSRLAARTKPHGRIVVDVPITGMNAESLVVIASTLQAATGSPAGWLLQNADHGPTLRLMSSPGTDSVPADPRAPLMPVVALPGGDHPPRSHSIQYNQIAASLRLRSRHTLEQLEVRPESHR